MSVIAIERTIDGVLTSADSTTLRIENSVGDVVVPTIPVVPTSPGIYSFTTTHLPAGIYTGFWTFTLADAAADTVARPFVVDPIIVRSAGILLQDIERLVARRCGSYQKIRGALGSTTNSIKSSQLKSTQNLGSFETEYALRRGYFWDGSLVPNFTEDDRVRGLDTFSSAQGILTVDRNYALQPQADEVIELMYLNPEEELRPAVLVGLTQCYFWDDVNISYSGLGQDLNVTEAIPWITDVSQVKRIQYGQLGSRLPPNRIQWSEPYRVGGNIYVRSQGVMAGTLHLTCLRPHSSFVNNEVSFTGPNDDLDALSVDPEYAAWASVRQLWIDNPERVAPLAAQNMRPTRDEVANEFTRCSLRIAEQVPDFIQHRWDMHPDLAIVGNLPEPMT